MKEAADQIVFAATVDPSGRCVPESPVATRLKAWAGRRVTVRVGDGSAPVMARCPECGHEEMPGELRNNEQNKRWWARTVRGVQRFLEQQKGHQIPRHVVHDGLKQGYLGMVENPLGGAPIARSTTTCSVREMADLQDRVEGDFAALGAEFQEYVER